MKGLLFLAGFLVFILLGFTDALSIAPGYPILRKPIKCGPVCAIFCQYGNIPDKNGCPTCRCRPAPCPLVKCSRHCPYGFALNKFGCQTCNCKPYRKPYYQLPYPKYPIKLVDPHPGGYLMHSKIYQAIGRKSFVENNYLSMSLRIFDFLHIQEVHVKEYKVKLYDRGGKSLTAQTYEEHFFPYPLAPGDLGEHIQAMKNMPSRSDDILVTSFPKSGTHWVMEAVHMLLNKTTEHFGKDFPSTTGDTDGLLLLEYLDISKMEHVKSPRLMVSHLRPRNIPKEFKGKIIHLTRNPKDVAVSYYNFVLNLKPVEYDGEWDDFIRLYIEGNVIFGPPFVYLREWRELRQEHPEYNILDITYEELHQDFVSVLRRMSSFLELDADDDLLRKICENCSIDKMRKSRHIKPDAHRPEFEKETDTKDGLDLLFRKGIVGDWKHWFTVAQSEMFDAAYEKAMNC